MAAEDDVYLQLSLQRALLGAVTPELRSVSAEIDLEKLWVYIRFIFAREPSDSEREAAAVAATEVIAAFSDGWMVDEEYQVLPPEERMSFLRLLVYHRCEDDWVSPYE
jgi:hypothetical protein